MITQDSNGHYLFMHRFLIFMYKCIIREWKQCLHNIFPPTIAILTPEKVQKVDFRKLSPLTLVSVYRLRKTFLAVFRLNQKFESFCIIFGLFTQPLTVPRINYKLAVFRITSGCFPVDFSCLAALRYDLTRDSPRQQTPRPFAQVPDAVPPVLVHSLAGMQVPRVLKPSFVVHWSGWI